MTRNRKLLKLSFACGLRRSWRIECCVSISTDKRQIVSYSILFYSADKRLKVGQHLSLSLSLGYFCAVRTYRVVCAPLSSYRFVSSMMHIRESGVHVHVLKFSLFLLLLLLLLLFVPPFPLLSAFLFFFFFPAAACFFLFTCALSTLETNTARTSRIMYKNTKLSRRTHTFKVERKGDLAVFVPMRKTHKK